MKKYKKRKPPVALDIRAERGAVAIDVGRHLIRRASREAYKAARRVAGARSGMPPLVETNVLLTDDVGIRELNKRARGVDEPTDVLSFPLADAWREPCRPAGGWPDNPETGRAMLGDIAISIERAHEQARRYGHSSERELAFLVVHGMLHLLGHSHRLPAGEEAMRAAQSAALRRLGLDLEGADAQPREPGSEARPHRAGFVALVGRANVGKSTLANALAGMPLAIVSSKPQTTRRNLRMILTTGSCQYVFVDTPGLHAPKNRLGKQMLRRAMSAAKGVDALALVVDARDDGFSADDRRALGAAARAGMPAVLVINKIDLVAKERLLPLIDKLRASHDFAAILPVSAKAAPQEASGIILRELERHMPEGPALYPADMLTDGTERELVADRIREKALLHLGDEVPHGVEVVIEQFSRDGEGGLARIRATVVCEKESHKKIIVGKSGASLKRIGQTARADIERMLGKKVFLGLWVKVRKDWRDDAAALRQLGHAERT